MEQRGEERGKWGIKLQLTKHRLRHRSVSCEEDRDEAKSFVERMKELEEAGARFYFNSTVKTTTFEY